MSLIHNILEKIGLSPGEIKVYLAGLKLGPCLASSLAKETNLKRPLVYHLLETLESKGLSNKNARQIGAKFSMEPAKRLLDILERQKKQIESMENKLETVLPEFDSIYQPISKPAKIRFYEGKEGLKNVAQETLKSKDKQFFLFSAMDNLLKMFDEEFMLYWAEQRKKQKIKSKSIWTTEAPADFLKTSLRNLRIAPSNMKVPCTIVIFDDKVAVFSPPEQLFVFVVESREFGQTMKIFFDSVWRKSKPVSST